VPLEKKRTATVRLLVASLSNRTHSASPWVRKLRQDEYPWIATSEPPPMDLKGGTSKTKTLDEGRPKLCTEETNPVLRTSASHMTSLGAQLRKA
jgi:hypothetical protein